MHMAGWLQYPSPKCHTWLPDVIFADISVAVQDSVTNDRICSALGTAVMIKSNHSRK